MKKWILLIAFIIAIFSLQLISTYGLFESNKDYGMEADLANFSISINGNEVTGSEHTYDVRTFGYYGDDNILNNRFAPGGRVYFDIEIEPNDTQVSFRYDVYVDLSYMTNSAIVVDNITSFVSNGEETISNDLILTDEATYSGVVLLDDIEEDTVITVRVSFKWDDIPLNGDVDYETMEAGYFNVPTSVHLVQYLGEELVPYEPPLPVEDSEDDSNE